MKQYEVWWASLPEPAGHRPVLLLSRNEAYSYLNKFAVVEVTSTIRRIAVEIALGRREGLPTKCVANCDNLRTVPPFSLDEADRSTLTTPAFGSKARTGSCLGVG